MVQGRLESRHRKSGSSIANSDRAGSGALGPPDEVGQEERFPGNQEALD